MARETLQRERSDVHAAPPANGAARPGDGGKGGRGWLVPVLILVSIGLLAWALWATFADGESSAGPEAGATLSEITSSPQEYVGSRVVVTGQVDQVLNTGAGVEEAEAITAQTTGGAAFRMGADESMLVVGSNMPQLAALAAEEDIAEGDIVQVTGTVRNFDLAEIESDLGVDFADDAFSGFDGDATIVASRVNLVPVTAAQQGEQLEITATNLIDQPQEFLGQQLTVNDVTVETEDEIISERAFGLGESIMVVGASGPTTVQPGFNGTVSGTLIEASSAQLLNAINVPNQNAQQLFDQLGIDESQIADYDYVLVGSQFRPGSGS